MQRAPALLALTVDLNPLTIYIPLPPRGWGQRDSEVLMQGEMKQDVVNRLRSIRGHLDGVLSMVEDDQ